MRAENPPRLTHPSPDPLWGCSI